MTYPKWLYRKDNIANAEYIECKHPIKRGEVAQTKVLREGLNIDLDHSGRIIGVEILS